MVWEKSPSMILSFSRFQDYVCSFKEHLLRVSENEKGSFTFRNNEMDIEFNVSTLNFDLIEDRHKEALKERLEELEKLKKELDSLSSISLEKTKSTTREEYIVREIADILTSKYGKKNKAKIYKYKKKDVYIFDWDYSGSCGYTQIETSNLDDVKDASLEAARRCINESIQKIKTLMADMY